MASSKQLATSISRIASYTYFLLIFLHIPLFRVRCGCGVCTTPMELTCSQLVITELCPESISKALFYPGAVARAIVARKTMPSYSNLLDVCFKSTNLRNCSSTFDLQNIEVLAGSYLSVIGAFLGLFMATRMSLFGISLIICGFFKDLFFKNASGIQNEFASLHPSILLPLMSAFLCIRKDLRMLISSCRPRHTKIKGDKVQDAAGSFNQQNERDKDADTDADSGINEDKQTMRDLRPRRGAKRPGWWKDYVQIELDEENSSEGNG